MLCSRFAVATHHLAGFFLPSQHQKQPEPHQRDEMGAGAQRFASSDSVSASPAPPSWVILGAIPRVAAADLPGGADHALALAPPPRVTQLTIARLLFPDGVARAESYPSIRAVEPSSGLLLLHADQGRVAWRRVIVDRADEQSFIWRDTIPGYFVLDPSKSPASAFALPEPELVSHPGNVGILDVPGSDGKYVVAELQPVLGSERARLRVFSSRTGEWALKHVRHPLPHRLMAPNGAVAHGGQLWWVDLSVGLVGCDPAAAAPELEFVPLPRGAQLPYREAWGVLDRYRSVGVSAGAMRFVDMYKNRDGDGALKVTVWTLDGPRHWAVAHEARLADVWAHPSYEAAGLPAGKVPRLALLDPERPHVVYFFLEEYLFGVDLRDASVVACEEHELTAPPREFLATRFVRAWQLPRELAACASF